MTSLRVHPSTAIAEQSLSSVSVWLVNVMLEPKSEGLNKNIKIGFPKGVGISWTLPGVNKHLQLREMTREAEISNSWESVQGFHRNQDSFKSFLSPKNKQDFAPLGEFLAQAPLEQHSAMCPLTCYSICRASASARGRRILKLSLLT